MSQEANERIVEMKKELIYEQESYQILGACFEVYKEKGAGFTEPVYQECLEIELSLRGIPFQAQPEINMQYKGRKLEKTFRPDFIVFGKIIVEIKAVSALCDEHRAQIQNYLNATGMQLGLLVNSGHVPKTEFERYAN